MLNPPPPYSRYFPSHFIEISSDSEDEGSSLATITKSVMTQRKIEHSTGLPAALRTTRQVPRSNMRCSGGPSPTPILSHGSLLLSSMPDLQPLLDEAPQFPRTSAIWPASRSPTSAPVQTRVPTSACSQTPAINSSPSSLLGIANTEINKIVADALDRYLSNQRPGMIATRVNTTGSYEDSSTIEFHDMGSPIAPWFAVTCGRCPGIYRDLQEALHALDPSKLSQLEFCKCEADAAVLFLRALMSSRVGVIQNGKLYLIGPGMPLVNMQ